MQNKYSTAEVKILGNAMQLNQGLTPEMCG